MPLQNTFDATPKTEVAFDTVTPGQGNTRLVLDVPDTVCIEAGTAKFRTAKNITILSETGADTAYSQRIRRWSSGCLTLAVVQESLAFLSERFVVGTSIADAVAKWSNQDGLEGVFNMIQFKNYSIAVHKLWQYPNGEGFVHQPNTNLSGDEMHTRIVAAGKSWNPGESLYPPAPQHSGEPGLIADTLLFTSPTVPLDTMGYSHRTHAADQGYFLRWLCPGVPLSAPDVILNFYFGQYCVIIGGSGEAILAEYCQPKGGGNYRWRRRTAFRYCKLGAAVNFPHTLTIFPHKGVNGEKYIAFAGNDVEANSAGGNLFGAASPKDRKANEFLYEATQIIRGGDKDESPESVTKPATVRLDVRRDLRINVHLSKLMFWRTGVISDAPIAMPDYHTLTQGGFGYEPRPFRTDFLANYPEDASGNKPSIDYRVRDAETLNEQAVRHPAVFIRFNGSDTRTQVDVGDAASFRSPILWGYTLSRPAQLETAAPGAFTLPVRTARVDDHTGPNAESAVAQVSAQVTTPESLPTFPTTAPGSVLTRLNNRSRFQARLVMDYQESPGAVKESVVLARGTATLPQGVKRGKPGGTFPDWHEYSFLMASVRDKLQAVTALAIDFETFAVDPAAPKDGDKQSPWKI
ncbi:MAG: hypothetical protein H7Y38_17270, partial [Armatimonadetes bacterium]|nr:hypothetical protein [Armatimonadota bacterium]